MKKETGGTENNAISLVREKLKGMQAMLDSSPVTNDEELAGVADKIKNVKMLAKAIKEKKDETIKPANEIIKATKATYDPMLKECENAEITLKERAGKYMKARDDERAAKEAKIAARVENGTMKPETAMKKLDELPTAEKTVRSDAGSGLRMSKRKVATITDMELIPDEYWIVDEVRVRREALDHDKYGKDPIPGVTITEESTIASV